MDKISGQVHCSGKIHRISITPGGPVIIHDHSRADLAAERIMIALGGDPCRCVQILRAWRTKDRSKLPVWARQLFDDSQQLSERRYRAKKAMTRDPLTRPIAYRILKRVTDLMRATARACNYSTCRGCRGPRNLPWANHHLTIAKLESHPNMRKTKELYSHIEIKLDLPRWHNHVYRHGLAVVDGVFVLDVLSRDEHGYIVLAGRQNADLSIETVSARVTVDASDVKMLTWLDDAKGGQ